MWVEILFYCHALIFLKSSSSWGCELKYNGYSCWYAYTCHPPREDVSWNIYFETLLIWQIVILLVRMWVEISRVRNQQKQGVRHPPREDVSWNISSIADYLASFSHPPREDVSWNAYTYAEEAEAFPSSSSWGCELKYKRLYLCYDRKSHPPREDVSWNLLKFRTTCL